MADTSTLFDLLSNRYRRRILLLLCENESVTVPDGLMERRAARPQGSSGDTGGRGTWAEERGPQRLVTRLEHCHLPKLEEEDLIQWDREAGTVTRGAGFGRVEPALSTIAANAEKFPADFL